MNLSDLNLSTIVTEFVRHDCDMTKKNVNTLGLVYTTQSVAGYRSGNGRHGRRTSKPI